MLGDESSGRTDLYTTKWLNSLPKQTTYPSQLVKQVTVHHGYCGYYLDKLSCLNRPALLTLVDNQDLGP